MPASTDRRDSLAIFFVLVAVLIIVHLSYTRVVLRPPLELAASVTMLPDGGAVTVSGRVLREGDPVGGARVWAVARDAAGNSFAPDPTFAGEDGSYAVGPIPRSISPDDALTVRSIEVRVRSPEEGWAGGGEKSRTIAIGAAQPVRTSKMPIGGIVLISYLFLTAIVLALVKTHGPLTRQTQYGGLIILTLTTIALVLFSLAAGLRTVEVMAHETPAAVISFGFAQATHATYLAGQPPQWIFSLTPIPIADDGRPPLPISGLGAPVWVLFVSVIGAGLFTLSLVVRAIKKPPDYSNEAEVCARAQEIVLHQFYLLFAPIGGIFVYQFLLAAGAASETLTVAITALAAGLALNVLLEKAVQALERATAGDAAAPNAGEARSA